MKSNTLLRDLGIRFDNLKISFVPYLLATLVTYIFIYLYSFFIPNTKEIIGLWKALYPFAVLVIPLSILQELFFRGYLMHVLRKKISKAVYVILLNALIFTITHIIFPYPQIILPGAFAIGIFLAWVYYYYPNLILVSISHILINLAVIPYCQLNLISC